MGEVMNPDKRLGFRTKMTRAAVRNLVADPSQIQLVYQRMKQMRSINPVAEHYYRDWEIILDGVFSVLLARSMSDLRDSLADVILMQSSRVPDLLAHSPLIVLVSQQERRDILRSEGINPD